MPSKTPPALWFGMLHTLKTDAVQACLFVNALPKAFPRGRSRRPEGKENPVDFKTCVCGKYKGIT
jgi:hypothetical protein